MPVYTRTERMREEEEMSRAIAASLADITPQEAAAPGVPSSQPASPSPVCDEHQAVQTGACMGSLGESHHSSPPPPLTSPPSAPSAEGPSGTPCQGTLVVPTALAASQDGGDAPAAAPPTRRRQAGRADQQPVPFPTNGSGEVVGRCRWHGCTSEGEYTSGIDLFHHFRDTHQGSVPAIPESNPPRYACSWGNGTTSGDGVCGEHSRGYSASSRNHLGSHVQSHLRRSGMKDGSMAIYFCRYRSEGCTCAFHDSKARTLHQRVCHLAPGNAQPAGDAGALGGEVGAVGGGEGGVGEEEEEAVGGGEGGEEGEEAVGGEKRKRGDEEEEDGGRGKEARVE